MATPNPPSITARVARRLYGNAAPAQRLFQNGSLAVLFDLDYYLLRNPDVATAKVDPWAHFLRWGLSEGRRANALFDPVFYLDRYPDVAEAGETPLLHFLKHGLEEGRVSHPYFDPDWYKRRYKELVEKEGSPPLIHYLRHGREAGIYPNPYFDGAWYAEQHLQGNPTANPLAHFVIEGERTGARPHPLFDENSYLADNRDVLQFLEQKGNPLWTGYRHFLECGATDLTKPGGRRLHVKLGGAELDFDEPAYVTDNPDVAQAVARGDFRNGVEHFFSLGFREALEGMRAIYAPNRMVRLLDRSRGEAEPSSGRYLCFFAHYDRDEIIDDYVVRYLEALRRQSVDILFISATQDNEQLARVRPYVLEIITKNEAGRDFGSWWLAIKSTPSSLIYRYESIIFANDSIYFPVRSPEAMFRRMEYLNYDLWGLTDSRESGRYHIQSFFLVFGPRARTVLDVFVHAYEQNIYLTKAGQILTFEIGLTEAALDADLSCGAYCPVEDIREDVLKDPKLQRWRELLRPGVDHINPTQQLWDLQVGYYDSPLLKLELLRDNTLGIQDVTKYALVIDTDEYDPRIIARHLKRLKSGSRYPRVKRATAKLSDTLNAQPQSTEAVPGQGFSANRLVLFVNFDPQGVVDPHVLASVQAFMRHDCDVLFITPTRSSTEIAKAAAVSSGVLVRPNIGRDLGAYQAGVRHMHDTFERYDTVFFVNDSFYFPLFDPAEMFRAAKARKLDFWGAVDSHLTRWHVMSWLWAFERPVMKSGFFDWFLAQNIVEQPKWSLIRNYEMRIPGMLCAQGFKAGAYIAADDVYRYVVNNDPEHPRLSTRRDFNMMHDFWDVIITEFRCPALKVELLRDNPLGLDISKVLDVVAERTEYSPNLIRNHLRRIKTGHLGIAYSEIAD